MINKFLKWLLSPAEFSWGELAFYTILFIFGLIIGAFVCKVSNL
jgi:hypothetical protein